MNASKLEIEVETISEPNKWEVNFGLGGPVQVGKFENAEWHGLKYTKLPLFS